MKASRATTALGTAASPSAARLALAALFAGQALATGATTVSTSLSSIVAVNLTGAEGLSGVPATVGMFASALAAYGAGQVMAARGRRFGLTLGYLVGAAGAGGAALAALSGNWPGFLTGSAVVGLANGAIQQGRYAAAELVPPGARGRTVGLLLSCSVLGAFLSAGLTPLVGRVAAGLGVPSIEFGWLLGAALLALGGLIVGGGLRAEPPAPRPDGPVGRVGPGSRTWPELLARPGVRLGLTSTSLGQGVMVMLMVLTPLHARHLGHELPTISSLLTAHFAGMYGLAWLTGRLADAWGPRAIALGGLLLGAAAALSIVATTAPLIGLSLFLLGLGWNFCYVGGSALLADEFRAHERARAQGAADLCVWLCAAAGALGGGLLVAARGFEAVGVVGLLTATVPLVAALLAGKQGRLERRVL